MQVLQPVEKSLLTALLRKSQTLAYAKYASALAFSCAFPSRFMNRLHESFFFNGLLSEKVDKKSGEA